MKKRLFDLIVIVISIVVAIIVGFYVIPGDNLETRETVIAVGLKNYIEKNQIIKATDLEMVEIGSYGLSRDIVLKKEEVVGKYAKTQLPNGIIIQKSFFQGEKEPVNAFLYEDPEFDGISFDTNLTRSVAGIAEKGDFVRAIIYLEAEDGNSESRVLMLEELGNLEIISISNNRGKNLDEIEDKTTNNSDNLIPAVVTVKADKNQQSLLVKYMNDGIIHLSLRPRILKNNIYTSDEEETGLSKNQQTLTQPPSQAKEEIVSNTSKDEKPSVRGFGIE